MAFIRIFLVSLFCLGPIESFSQDHSGRRSLEASSFSEQVGFRKSSGLFPIPLESQRNLQREEGRMFSGTPFETLGARVYLGEPGSPQGDLELFGVLAGRAKTYRAAEKACTDLPPLGKWRLASIVQVKAFFEELLPGFPVPQDPNQLGFLFWAESEDPKFNKTNRNTFFTTPKGSDLKIEMQVFTKFINRVRRIQSQSKTPVEKEYAKRFLEFLEAGIPVLCVFGNG